MACYDSVVGQGVPRLLSDSNGEVVFKASFHGYLSTTII